MPLISALNTYSISAPQILDFYYNIYSNIHLKIRPSPIYCTLYNRFGFIHWQKPFCCISCNRMSRKNLIRIIFQISIVHSAIESNCYASKASFVVRNTTNALWRMSIRSYLTKLCHNPKHASWSPPSGIKSQLLRYLSHLFIGIPAFSTPRVSLTVDSHPPALHQTL